MAKSNFIVRGGADFSGINNAMKKMQTTIGKFQTGIETSMNGMKNTFANFSKMIAGAFAVNSIKNFVSESRAAYAETVQHEQKLATVMKARMGASNEAIQSMLDFMAAEQKLGVVSSDVMTAGAQELATYIDNIDALKTVIPVLNNIATQQYGVNVTAEQMQQTATMLGKVMDGQLGGLSRWGYSWEAAEEAILKNGTALEKAATIAKVVSSSVGDMNYALAQTDVGRQKQLATVFGDIKTQFGAAFNQIAILFLPTLRAVANWLAKIASLARQVAQLVAQAFGGKEIAEQAKVQTNLVSSAASAATAEQKLGNAVEKAGKQAKKFLAPFDEIYKVQSNISDGAADTADAFYDIGGIGAGFADDLFTDGIQAGIKIDPKLERTIGNIITKIKEFIEAFKIDPITAVSEAVWDLIGGLFNLSDAFSLSGLKKADLSGFSFALETLIGAFALSSTLKIPFPLALAISALTTSGLVTLFGKDTAISGLGAAISGIATGFMTYKLTGNPALATALGVLSGALVFFIDRYTDIDLVPALLTGLSGGFFAFTKLKLDFKTSALLGLATAIGAFVVLNELPKNAESVLLGVAAGLTGIAGAFKLGFGIEASVLLGISTAVGTFAALSDIGPETKAALLGIAGGIVGLAIAWKSVSLKDISSLNGALIALQSAFPLVVIGAGAALAAFVAFGDMTPELSIGLGVLSGVLVGLGAAWMIGFGPVGIIVGAVAGLVTAIASIGIAMSKDAIPAVKKFADDVSDETKRMVEPLIDSTNAASQEITKLFATAEPLTKENTSKITGYFKDMADTVKSELEKMKESAINNLAAIFGESAQQYEQDLKKVTKFYDDKIAQLDRFDEELADAMMEARLKYGEDTKEYANAVKELKKENAEKLADFGYTREQLEEGRNKEIQHLNDSLDDETKLYVKNREDTVKHYDEKIKINEDKYDEINGVIKQKMIDGEAITAEEYETLKGMQEGFLQNGIDNLAANTEEAKSIANTRKEDLTRLAADEAVAILQEQKKSKDEQIKEAQALYNDALAEAKKKSGGILTEEEFLRTEIGKKAKQSCDDQIAAAEQTYDGVVQALKDANPDIMSQIDETHAKIKSKWTMFCEDHEWAKTLDGLGKKIGNAFKSIGDKVSSAWSDLFGGDKSADVTITANTPASPSRNISTAIEPVFAASGTVAKPRNPFVAILGDNTRETEVVSPLSTMKEAFLEAMSQSGLEGKDINITVQFTNDSDDLAALLAPKISVEQNSITNRRQASILKA